MSVRILVTGSRDWARSDQVKFALDCIVERETNVTVVHGDCPTGADAIAAKYAKFRGWAVEAHPADWSKGKGEGPARNQRMVDLGADIVLAFISDCHKPEHKDQPRHLSHGTVDCVTRAQKAGLSVHRIYAPADE